MSPSPTKPGIANELKALLAPLVDTVSESLGSLAGCDVAIHPEAMQVRTVEALVGALPRATAVARGSLGGTFEGHRLLAMFELPDAVALAGLLMMAGEDVIAQRRTLSQFEEDDRAAFGELATVLYSGFANALQAAAEGASLQLQDHAVVQPGSDPDGTLGAGELAVFEFRMKVGEFPESRGALAIDLAVGQKLKRNTVHDAEEAAAPAAGAANTAPPPRAEEESYDAIPAAPIRGTLAAFVAHNEAFRLLRLSCRRVGLELRRHGRGEIPNPAAHRNEFVVLDVPVGEERRFDWCRRVKELSDSTVVVLLLHHPSRARVKSAFLSRADAILGFPCEEAQLSQKLAALLEGEPAAPSAKTPGGE